MMMQQRPIANKGFMCPLYKQDVSKVCHKCEWYTLIRGKHPLSEEIIDQWGCAVRWIPTLLTGVAQETRQGAAATESFRNIMVGMADRAARIGQDK